MCGGDSGLGSILSPVTNLLFGQTPKVPDINMTPPAVPDIPEDTTGDAVSQAKREERRRLLSKRGRASTVATSGLGDTSDASVAVKTLLGGA